MKTILHSFYLVLVILIATPTFAQMNEEDQSAQIIAYWDKGESYTYRVEVNKIDIKPATNDSIRKAAFLYETKFTVLDSTASSYKVEMDVKPYILTDLKGDSDDWKYLPGMDFKLIYMTDEMGSLTEIVNADYLETYVKMANASKSNANANTNELLEKYDAAQYIKNFMNFIKYYHNFFGISLTENSPVEMTKQENEEIKLGKTKLYFDVNVELHDMDFENENYMITYHETYYPIKGDAVMEFFAQLIGVKPDKKIKKEFKKMELNIATRQTSLMHNSGVPLELYFEKTVEIDFDQEKQQQVESFYMEML